MALFTPYNTVKTTPADFLICGTQNRTHLKFCIYVKRIVKGITGLGEIILNSFLPLWVTVNYLFRHGEDYSGHTLK